MDRETLLDAARGAAQHAYAPYSGFRVGAAVFATRGLENRVVLGANVENASLGLTLCAERAALSATRMLPAEEDKNVWQVTHIAISCLDAAPSAPVSARMPCGACRQWIAELAPDAIVYVDGVAREFRLADLLPEAFRLDSQHD